jgi:radical SAM superfamily enzyme YgiQ (UPF0313 family)
VVHEEFPIAAPHRGETGTLNGVYSFLDIFGGERKTLDDYRQLAEHGVKRIYIGLETGDPDLFKLLNKPGSPQECVEVVRTIKAAGIAVGVIILAGAGGEAMAQQHVDNSLRALLKMQPGVGDIVYLSPLVLAGDDEYSQRMQELGIRELSREEMIAQVNTFKAAFKGQGRDRPRVTLYSIEDFLY